MIFQYLTPWFNSIMSENIRTLYERSFSTKGAAQMAFCRKHFVRKLDIQIETYLPTEIWLGAFFWSFQLLLRQAILPKFVRTKILYISKSDRGILAFLLSIRNYSSELITDQRHAVELNNISSRATNSGNQQISFGALVSFYTLFI